MEKHDGKENSGGEKKLSRGEGQTSRYRLKKNKQTRPSKVKSRDSFAKG